MTTEPTATPLPPTATTEPAAAAEPTPTLLPTPDTLTLLDFNDEREAVNWFLVNDTVMGGVSTSGGAIEDGVLNFYGDLSLDNNGGFTSVRRAFSESIDGYAGIRLRVLGDGRSYYLRLRDNSTGREVEHEVLFETTEGEWRTIDLPFEAFVANFRGFPIDHPPLDTTQLRAISFMLREKNPGAFALQVDSIEAYR